MTSLDELRERLCSALRQVEILALLVPRITDLTLVIPTWIS